MGIRLNSVFIAGNLTRDPELRVTTGGTSVCSFVLAVNKKYTQGNEQKEEVAFIKVVAWGKLGELCAEYLKKGSGALVIGRLKQERWETEGGDKKEKTCVYADQIQFLEKPKNKSEEEEYAEEEAPF